jgi:hypothetical protein
MTGQVAAQVSPSVSQQTVPAQHSLFDTQETPGALQVHDAWQCAGPPFVPAQQTVPGQQSAVSRQTLVSVMHPHSPSPQLPVQH